MSLRKQAASLAIMHAADILQPLLVLPYAGLVLGPERFGQFAYAMSLGQIAATLVEYGFHWTAQRTAAAARARPAALTVLLAEVTATKALLCMIVVAFGLAAAGALYTSRTMMLCAMLTAIGNVVFPAWLFIGTEQAWQAMIGVVAGRLFALTAFLVLVTSPARVELAVAIQSAVPLISGIVAIPFVIGIGLTGFREVRLARIRLQLREGWRGFLFTLAERASLSLPVPLVQHFGGFVVAGQYSLAEKFVSTTRPFSRVLSETFLPRVAYHAEHDPAAGIALVRRAGWSLIVSALLSLALFFVAPFVITIIFGTEFAGAVPIVRVMAVMPILLNANLCTSTLYMFNFGHERAWSLLNVTGLATFLAAAFVLGPRLQNAAIAVAVAVVAKEAVVLAVSAVFFLAFASAPATACPPMTPKSVTPRSMPPGGLDVLTRNEGA